MRRDAFSALQLRHDDREDAVGAADGPSLSLAPPRTAPDAAHDGAPAAAVHGIVLVDADGLIRFCNDDAARVFGSTAVALAGQPISARLPDLRLKAGTPGYNLAYALFWFPCQRWRKVHAVGCDGGAFPLQISLSTIRINGRHQLVLGLRA